MILGIEYKGHYSILILNSSHEDIVKVSWPEPIPMGVVLLRLRLSASKSIWNERIQTESYFGFQIEGVGEWNDVDGNGLYKLLLARDSYVYNEKPLAGNFETTFFMFSFKLLSNVHLCSNKSDTNCIVREKTMLLYHNDTVNQCEMLDSPLNSDIHVQESDGSRVATVECLEGYEKSRNVPVYTSCLTWHASLTMCVGIAR